MSELRLSAIQFSQASPGDVETGLLGYISAIVNDSILMDGITLRRTADARATLSFPARRDGEGRQHFFIRPLDDRARLEIERQVFAALGIEESA